MDQNTKASSGHIVHFLSLTDTSLLTNFRSKASNSLGISDILPLNMKLYDKNQPPKYRGEPTTVYFHVTVISLDSINEESMVSIDRLLTAMDQEVEEGRLQLDVEPQP